MTNREVVSIATMAVALGSFMVKGTLESAIVFGLSAALYGFVTFLQAKHAEDRDTLKAQIAEVKAAQTDFAIRLGWGA